MKFAVAFLVLVLLVVEKGGSPKLYEAMPVAIPTTYNVKEA